MTTFTADSPPMAIRHLKLYHAPAARSARVKWLLHELLGDAFETVTIALDRGEHHDESFASLNPDRTVPLLEIAWGDGECQRIIESAAMLAFLADAYPQGRLAPPPGASPQRAAYLQMLHFASTSMDAALWQLRLHERLLPLSERDSLAAARYRKQFIQRIEPRLARSLDSSTFICGEAFSAADCVVGHCILWARRHGLCLGELFDDYVASMAARPAFIKAFADAPRFLIPLRRSLPPSTDS